MFSFIGLLDAYPKPFGTLKINFDGSRRGDQGTVGFFIRDHYGHFCYNDTSRFPITSIPMIELRVVREGFMVAVYTLQCKSILLEGDSNTVIKWIIGKISSTPSSLLLNILHLSAPLNFLTVNYIFRENNFQANILIMMFPRVMWYIHGCLCHYKLIM